MTTPSGLPTRALQWWGVASGAVNQRANTAGVWAAITSAATSQGLPSAGLSLSDFNALRSAAAGVRNSSEAFAAGNPDSALQDTMIGLPPWARAQNLRNDAPQFQVRFLHTTVDMAGNEQSSYKTVVFTGQLPATKAELLLQVDRDAQVLADKYNSEHVGTSEHTIMAV